MSSACRVNLCKLIFATLLLGLSIASLDSSFCNVIEFVLLVPLTEQNKHKKIPLHCKCADVCTPVCVWLCVSNFWAEYMYSHTHTYICKSLLCRILCTASALTSPMTCVCEWEHCKWEHKRYDKAGQATKAGKCDCNITTTGNSFSKIAKKKNCIYLHSECTPRDRQPGHNILTCTVCAQPPSLPIVTGTTTSDEKCKPQLQITEKQHRYIAVCMWMCVCTCVSVCTVCTYLWQIT